MKQLRKEYIRATVVTVTDDLSLEQQLATLGAMEISENLLRKDFEPSTIFEMEEKLQKFRTALPRNFSKAKKDLESLKLALDIAKGKEKTIIEKRIQGIEAELKKAANNFDVKELLYGAGYSKTRVDGMSLVHKIANDNIGSGVDVLKKIEQSNVDQNSAYRVISKEIKNGNTDIVNRISEAATEKDVRNIISKYQQEQKEQRLAKQKKVPEDNNFIEIEEVMYNYYKVNGMDFVTQDHEDKMILNNKHQLVIRHGNNSSLNTIIYSAFNNQFDTLVITPNKRSLDNLINNLKKNYRRDYVK